MSSSQDNSVQTHMNESQHHSDEESESKLAIKKIDKMSKVKWSIENERILVEWCDIAQCYKWLNTRAHSSYAYINMWFTIPAIILSTFSGTASFAQESIPDRYKSMTTMIIGSVNIAVGIITTIQQYLKISELNEAHRVSAIAWDKYARNIRIELSKAPDERPSAGLFLKYNREEFDRLMETSPSIPESIIKEFKRTFINTKDPNIKKHVDKLKLPDICDILVSAEETRHHWYKEVAEREKTELEQNAENDILSRQKTLREQEQQMRDKKKDLENKEKNIEQLEKETVDKYNSLIDKYKVVFSDENGRLPSKTEIIKHFDGLIDKDFIEKIIPDDGDDNV
jgi:hypothetical protein